MVSIITDDFNGLLNSIACDAFNNSIANNFSMFSITLKHLVAAFAPMLTWSSCPLLDTILSILAGVHNCLF